MKNSVVLLTKQQYEDLKKERTYLHHDKKPTPVTDYLKQYGVDGQSSRLASSRKPNQIYEVWVETGLVPSPNEMSPPKTLRRLSFGGALKLLKEGKKVKRKDWGGYWIIDDVRSNVGEEQRDVYNENHMWSQIIAKLKDGGYAPAQPYQADLLAEDWEEVE